MIGTACWRRQAPGWYVSDDGTHEIVRVYLDDGPWWIIRYPDGSNGDPFPTLTSAKLALAPPP